MQPNAAPANGVVKKFTTNRKTVEFYIDDDLFRGVPVLPTYAALDLVEAQKKITEAKASRAKIDAIVDDVFGQFLQPESLDLLKSRLSDKVNPIDLPTLFDVIQWLLGDGYGLRPTQPSTLSEPGRSETGASSTAGALPEESTPSLLTGTAT